MTKTESGASSEAPVFVLQAPSQGRQSSPLRPPAKADESIAPDSTEPPWSLPCLECLSPPTGLRPAQARCPSPSLYRLSQGRDV